MGGGDSGGGGQGVTRRQGTVTNELNVETYIVTINLQYSTKVQINTNLKSNFHVFNILHFILIYIFPTGTDVSPTCSTHSVTDAALARPRPVCRASDASPHVMSSCF